MERRYLSGYLLLCVKPKENPPGNAGHYSRAHFFYYCPPSVYDTGLRPDSADSGRSYCGAGHSSAAHGTGRRVCADVHDPDGVDMSSGSLLEKI